MNAVVMMGDSSVFDGLFEVVESNQLAMLLKSYAETREKIITLAEMVNAPGNQDLIGYFVDGNVTNDRYCPSYEGLFNAEGAIASLNASYWSKALKLTDVYEYMPQKRRDEWNELIRTKKTLEFTEEALIPTIEGLLNSRGMFMAERVDGLFRVLSGEHVTNRPEGFSKYMIINYAFDESGWPDYQRSGYLSDLRQVISKLIGREHKHWYSDSSKLMTVCRKRTGLWHDVDEDTLRIKTFKKGTMHLEVHPDIALQLNEILAYIYPNAIPHMYKRRKTEKGYVNYTLMQHPLSGRILKALMDLTLSRTGRNLKIGFIEDKHFRQSVYEVLEEIGGIIEGDTCYFEYDVSEVLDDIILNGYVPEQKTHQFYPTPEKLAAKAVLMADIVPGHTCLEPSAGQGGLARFMPKESSTCVEISDMHCSILRAKGFDAVQADFIQWAKTSEKFDRIVMNPPFSQGRAQIHLETAASLLKPGGRLVAILPASFAGKTVLSGCSTVWSDDYENQFADTGISVVILTAERL